MHFMRLCTFHFFTVIFYFSPVFSFGSFLFLHNPPAHFRLGGHNPCISPYHVRAYTTIKRWREALAIGLFFCKILGLFSLHFSGA